MNGRLEWFDHLDWSGKETFLQPTVFHVTHHKSGSQWVAEILQQCAPERFRRPRTDLSFFYERPIEPGMVYLTLYVPRGDFDAVACTGPGPFPGRKRFFSRHPVSMTWNWFHFQLRHAPVRRFVVIRDLRDTLVSLYFSFKISHVLNLSWQFQARDFLNSRSEENGFLGWIGSGSREPFDGFLKSPFVKSQYGRIDRDVEASAVAEFLRSILDYIADIQLSWIEGDDLLVRYEDLLCDEDGTFERIVEHCQIDVTRRRLHEIIRRNNFEAITGRRRGDEDVTAHHRKGIAGDWRNYFTERIKARFKARFGDVLIRTGYEANLDW